MIRIRNSARAARCGTWWWQVRRLVCLLALFLAAPIPAGAQQESRSGGINGTIEDADFSVPIANVRVQLSETRQLVLSGEDGHYLLAGLPAGTYTLVCAKDGFRRETRANVLVKAGAITELNVRLFGEFTDMDELVVRDIEIGGASEAGLITLKQQAATALDAVGAETIGRAGQSTAAGALKLVSGASVEGGKYAVIRGLGDRYTSTQINSVRLPSADPDKRAVQLDQFSSAMIESLQVSKTFLPDQQGDSGAGTINIVTRSVPEAPIASFKVGTAYKPGITGSSSFRSNPRSTSYWGEDDRDFAIRSQQIPTIGRRSSTADRNEVISLSQSLDPRAGTTTEAPPPDHSWSVTVGDVYRLGEDWRAGGIGTFSYSCKYEGYNGGQNHTLVQPEGALPGDPLIDPNSLPFVTSLGVQKILWGGSVTAGVRKEDEQDVGVTFTGNHAADSYAQENVYNQIRANPSHTGYQEVLDYLERDFYTMQEHGRNTLPLFENVTVIPGWLSLQAPVLEWTFAQSDSLFYEPDRTVTYAEYDGSSWLFNSSGAGAPPAGRADKWYTIDEQSRQFFFSLKQPFETGAGSKGYLKAGVFEDRVKRRLNCDYVAYRINGIGQAPGPDPIWDSYIPTHIGLNSGQAYVAADSFSGQPPCDYVGNQEIRAWYVMGDLPTFSWLHVLGGMRFETTELQTKLKIVPPLVVAPGYNILPVFIQKYDEVKQRWSFVIDSSGENFDYTSGASLKQVNALPAIGVLIKPEDDLQLRLNWSQTIARPTFKEITPIMTPIQGTSDFFIGNRNLKISTMDNYDARLEFFPGVGNLLAGSVFLKRITDPIDRVLLQSSSLRAIMPLNFPEATVKGCELEARQDMGALWQFLGGLTLGANGTLLQSDLKFDEGMQQTFRDYSGDKSRPMIGQPDYLANLNATYDIEAWGLSLNLYYTFQGTTLVAGEAVTEATTALSPNDATENWTPNVYQKPVGTLNMGFSQKIGSNWKLSFNAKNVLRPAATQYYDYHETKVVRARNATPIEYSFGLEGKW